MCVCVTHCTQAAHCGSSGLERAGWLRESWCSSEVQDHPVSPRSLQNDESSARPASPRAKGELAPFPPTASAPSSSPAHGMAAISFGERTDQRPFFSPHPPIQADNWASASAACCSASAFQQTAGASGATPGSATVIPALPPPRFPGSPSHNIVPSASRMFLSPPRSCEFFYILKRNLFLIFLPGHGLGRAGASLQGGACPGTAAQEDPLPPWQLPATAPGRCQRGQDVRDRALSACIRGSQSMQLHGLSLPAPAKKPAHPTRGKHGGDTAAGPCSGHRRLTAASSARSPREGHKASESPNKQSFLNTASSRAALGKQEQEGCSRAGTERHAARCSGIIAGLGLRASPPYSENKTQGYFCYVSLRTEIAQQSPAQEGNIILTTGY